MDADIDVMEGNFLAEDGNLTTDGNLPGDNINAQSSLFNENIDEDALSEEQKDDGILFLDGMRMFKHILFHYENGIRTVQGFLLSATPETNMARKDIMLIADNDPIQYTINEGWRLDDEGNWLPPEMSKAAVRATLEQDIADLECQLRILREYEDTAKWLEVVPFSEECDAILPAPLFHKQEMPHVPKFNNLFEAFKSLVGDDERGIVGVDANTDVQTMETGQPIAENRTMAADLATRGDGAAEMTAPIPIPPKGELIALIKEKRTQLANVDNETIAETVAVKEATSAESLHAEPAAKPRRKNKAKEGADSV